eukprot:jgi/Tetstr1/421874/TSEL_012774.t1
MASIASPLHVNVPVEPCTAALLPRLTAASGLPGPAVLNDALRLLAFSRGLTSCCTGGTSSESLDAPRASSSRDAEATPPPTQPDAAASGATLQGNWGSPAEWLPKVFRALEDEAGSLAAARLVCRDWASGVMGSVSRLSLRYAPTGVIAGLVSQCSELRALELALSGESSVQDGATERLLGELRSFGLVTERESAAYESLHPALSSLTRITDLQLEIIPSFRTESDLSELQCLPECLTRLSLDGAFFPNLRLRDLRFAHALTELTMHNCTFYDAIGLSSATSLTRLDLGDSIEPNEEDLQDILGLTRLEHLRVKEYSTTDARYARRLAESLGSLTSLALPQWLPRGVEALQPLTALTALTELEVGVERRRPGDAMSAGMWHLGSLTRLKQLALHFDSRDMTTTEQVLSRLERLKQLHSLDVRNGFLDADTAQLLPCQLRRLGLECCFVNDETDTLRPDFHFYSRIFVRSVTETLAAVADRCPGLTSIDLPSNDGLSLCALVSLVDNFDHLEHIHMDCEALAYHSYAQLPLVLDALLMTRPNPSKTVHQEPWHGRNHIRGNKWQAIRGIVQQQHHSS